jgi:hypothetical protein
VARFERSVIVNTHNFSRDEHHDQIKDAISMALRSADLKIDSLTAEKIEADRIQRQIVIGQFDKPAFPLLDGMETFDSAPSPQLLQLAGPN